MTDLNLSPDFMMVSTPLEHRIDEDGVLTAKLTPKEIKEGADARGEEVKDASSKALSEGLDSYESGVYHGFDDKRYLSALE